MAKMSHYLLCKRYHVGVISRCSLLIEIRILALGRLTYSMNMNSLNKLINITEYYLISHFVMNKYTIDFSNDKHLRILSVEHEIGCEYKLQIFTT